MARISGPFKSSVNAGQLSKSLLGKVNLKQYYSGAKRMSGFEPIQQSGMTLMPGSVHVHTYFAEQFAKGILRVTPDLSYTLVFSPGMVDIFRNDHVLVVTLEIAAITAGRLPNLQFYGEANTFGVFHPVDWDGIRIRRNPADDSDWTVDAWPYTDIPEVDLGGSYPKTDDVWVFHIRWSGDVTQLSFSFSVEGNTTDTVQLLDTVTGEPGNPDLATANWAGLAVAIRDAIRSLPGLSGTGVTVSAGPKIADDRYIEYTLTFGGDLSGSEYGVDASVVNTSNASILTSHSEIGRTEGERLISSSQGGFAGMTLFQDRAVYFAPKGRATAMAMSRNGEYFDLNIKRQDDAGARLEGLRSDTGEEILHMIDATYLLAFTDQAEYFASNRTIKRNEPLNWVRASEVGTRRNCRPVTMGSDVYFVSRDGGVLYRTSYDAVSEAFDPVPINDLNGDLVTRVKALVVQKKTAQTRSDRLWILRDDGVLLLGIVNVAQEIPLAVSEWPRSYNGGQVRAIAVDGQDKVWLTISRGFAAYEEVLDESALFQGTVATNSSGSGVVDDLFHLNGYNVWVEALGDVYGPYLVSGDEIQTDVGGRPVKVGIWEQPVFESMPYIRVLPNDEVVRRPGKVGSVRLYLDDAASIAIGANGQAPRDVSLARASDDLDAVNKKNFSGHATVVGLKGACMDPTLTITQVRPGRLTVRDYIPGTKL